MSPAAQTSGGMSALERDLRQRRDEACGLAILGDGEAAHQAARRAGVENIEDDEPWRAARDDAAFAQKDDERGPRVRGQRQRAAQLMNELTACDTIEIHSSLHQYQQRSA
ncbi:MAG TPA: hypothetical protein VIG36_08625 [Methylocystis sp.]